MKRIVTFILCATLVFQFIAPVNAEYKREVTFLEGNDHVCYDSNNKYYFVEYENGNSIYMPAEVLRFDFSSKEKINELISAYDIPKAIINDIFHDYDENMQNPEVNLNEGMLIMSSSNPKETKTVNGYSMRLMEYVTSGSKVKVISTGTGTITKVRNIAGIISVINKAGVETNSITKRIVLSGTLIGAYCSLMGVNITSLIESSNDRWDSEIVFTLYKDYYQYCSVSSWQVGLVTAKVVGYDKNTLKLLETSATPATISSSAIDRQGSHFGATSAWTYALNYTTDNGMYEYPEYTIGGVKFTFA